MITQNIDRLHRAAGSQRVIEVHGSIETSSCICCGASYGVESVDALFGAEGIARVPHLPGPGQAGRRPLRRAAARGGDDRRPRRWPNART